MHMQGNREMEHALGLGHAMEDGAVLLGQEEWGLGEKYGRPTKYGVWSRSPSRVMFLA